MRARSRVYDVFNIQPFLRFVRSSSTCRDYSPDFSKTIDSLTWRDNVSDKMGEKSPAQVLHWMFHDGNVRFFERCEIVTEYEFLIFLPYDDRSIECWTAFSCKCENVCKIGRWFHMDEMPETGAGDFHHRVGRAPAQTYLINLYFVTLLWKQQQFT